MRHPSFICIGAQKAGTTSLQEILSQHPSIFLSPLKEIKFFHRDEHYCKGLEWYLNHFKDAQENQIIGDITPDYLLYRHTPERIFRDLGKDIKIIVFLRNPVDRAFSQFNFHRAKNVEKNTDFKSIIKNHPPLDYVNETFVNWHTPSYYIERGLYYNQLKRYFDIFPKENFHISIFEEFFGSNKEEELNKLLSFIGVEKVINNTNVHSHSTRIPKKNVLSTIVNIFKSTKVFFKLLIPKETYLRLRQTIIKSITQKPDKLDHGLKKELLNRFYMDDILKLEQLIERDLGIWK